MHESVSGALPQLASADGPSWGESGRVANNLHAAPVKGGLERERDSAVLVIEEEEGAEGSGVRSNKGGGAQRGGGARGQKGAGVGDGGEREGMREGERQAGKSEIGEERNSIVNGPTHKDDQVGSGFPRIMV